MVYGRKSMALADGSCVTAAPTPSGRFATGLFEAIREDGLRVLDCPSIGEHVVETGGVVVKAQQQLTQVRPRLNPVTLGTGEDGEQDGRSRPGFLVAQEQPVFSSDCLVTQRAFADIVVDR